MASGVITGSTYSLPGGNKIYLKIEWSESISGTTNTITANLKAYSYSIYGTWACRLIINGEDFGAPRVAIRHGTGSSIGSSVVRTESKTISYTGNKSITITGKIENMDYRDVGGAGSTVINPVVSGTASLSYIAPPNSAPPIPNIITTNTKVGSNYICESNLNAALGAVTDPDGDTVTYAIYGRAKRTPSSSWEKLGDSQGCILWSSSTRSIGYNITSYPRGTQFEIWGRTFDSKNAGSGSSSSIANIYRNSIPSKVTAITPNGAYLNDESVSFSWNASTDSNGQTVSYKVFRSFNDGAYSLITESTNTSYTESLSMYNEGIKVRYKIIATDGMADSEEFITNYFVKNSKPTKPSNIFPNSGYYAGVINITWNKSTDPEGRGIASYKVYINDALVGTTRNTSISWTMPSADPEGKSYLISIIATDVDNKSSEKGTASGTFYKALKQEAPTFLKPTEKYFTDKIEIEWKANLTNGNDILYNLDYKINSGTWISVLANSNKTATSISILDVAEGSKIQFRINCIDSLGQVSNYAYSSLCYKNNKPKSPIIEYPLNNSVITSKRARLCIKTTKDLDNHDQKIIIYCNGRLCSSSNTTSPNFTFSNKESTTNTIIFTTPLLNNGVNNIQIQSHDGYEYSPMLSMTINLESQSNVAYMEYITYDNIFLILYSLNKVRQAYGLSKLNIPILAPNQIIQHSIIADIKQGIEEVINFINEYDILNPNKIQITWEPSKAGDFIMAKTINNIIENMTLI